MVLGRHRMLLLLLTLLVTLLMTLLVLHRARRATVGASFGFLARSDVLITTLA